MGMDLDNWCKLDGNAFSSLAKLFLAAEECFSQEQGLFQLMVKFLLQSALTLCCNETDYDCAESTRL